ncbi:MAG: GNAT family N-acetyltransferase, partial [Chloroflexota bacterium]
PPPSTLMAVISSTFKSSHNKHLRPFDARRDMTAAADLIEFCFGDSMDPDGKRYLSRMRAAAKDKGLSRWTAMANGRTSFPLAGFVWEEGGRLVGNLSMVSFFTPGRRIFMIANISVYPEYRRRGIARALTEAALQKSRQRWAQAVWLQVRDDNPTAANLYASLGFEPRARRTTWNIKPEMLPGETPQGVNVTPRKFRHWSRQRTWLEQNYPKEIRWHLPLKIPALRPGLWGMAHRFFTETYIRQWAIQRDNRLLGVLSWQASRSHADRFWLAARPESEDAALESLLPFIRQEQYLRRPVSLDYPAGRAVEALQSAGFTPESTLLWMEAKL